MPEQLPGSDNLPLSRPSEPGGLSRSRRLIWLTNGLVIAYVLQAALVLAQSHPSLAAAMLAVSAALSDQGFLAVLAVALLQITAQFAPEDRPLQWRARRNLEARLLSALLLLLVPLQLLVGWGELQRLDGAIHGDTAAVASRLREVRRAILAATTASGLQAELARLQAPPLPADLLGQPLPQLKGSLLRTLAVAESRTDRGSAASIRERSNARALLVRRLAQTCLLALLYAFSLSPHLLLALQRRRPGLGLTNRLSRNRSGSGDGLGIDYYFSLSREQDNDGRDSR